jgi:hypothetical protein
MLQAEDLMDSFGSERAVFRLTLLPTGKRTNVTLHLKAPIITMNAKGIVDDTDVVCYVGVILATSAGNNTDNRLFLIALAEWSGGMSVDYLRVFTDQTAYLVYRAYDAPLWLAYIEPRTLHAIPTELRSYGAILHHHELQLAIRSIARMEALPEWTMAGIYGSVGTGGSNFAGQTLQQGAQPKYGRRRMAQACITITEYRAFHPAIDAAGQHVTFWAVSNSAAGSGRWYVAAALRCSTTITDGDNSKCTHRRADIYLVPINGKTVGLFAHIDGLAQPNGGSIHMWTDADPLPTSGNAFLGPLSEPPIERVSAVRRVLTAAPRGVGVCHISSLHDLTMRLDHVLWRGLGLSRMILAPNPAAHADRAPTLNWRDAEADCAPWGVSKMRSQLSATASAAASNIASPFFWGIFGTDCAPSAGADESSSATTLSGIFRQPVLHTLAASFLVMCIVSGLSLCPDRARLVALRSLLILLSLKVLPGLYRGWCGTLVLTERCGESHGPPPVRRDGSMWAAFEPRQVLRPPRVIFSDGANNGPVDVRVITAQLHFW